MNDPMLKQAHKSAFCQTALRELAKQLPADDAALDHLLAEAVAAKDDKAFTHLILAALDAGRKVDARHLVHGTVLLPNPGVIGTVSMHVAGNVAEALAEAVVKGNMDTDWSAIILATAVGWCRDHGYSSFPPGLMSAARTLARKTSHNPIAEINLRSLADITGDAELGTILEANGCPEGLKHGAILVDEMTTQFKAEVFAKIPEQPGPVVHSGFTVRRAVPKLGRNEPCHCGSGKKYKLCCESKDKERLRHSSDVEGVTEEELRENEESYLTEKRLCSLLSYELARLDPTKVSPELLPLLIDELLLFSECEAVINIFEKVGYHQELAVPWEHALYYATQGVHRDWVQRLVRLRPEVKVEDLGLGAQLLLADEAPSPVLGLIESASLKGLRSERPSELVDLASTLLTSRYPALGILVARSVLPITNYFEAITVFQKLLETRDRLELFSKDSFQQVLGRLFEEERETDPVDNRAQTEAIARLREKDKEVRDLNAQLNDLKKELEKRVQQAAATALQASPLPVPVPPTEDRALLELRHRMESKEEQLKQVHNERNQVRRDLEKKEQENRILREKVATAQAGAAREAGQEEDRFLLPEESMGIQPVRIPDFPRKFVETMATLPERVRRSAMLLVGKLAAGEAAAFTGMKKLRTTQEILRQRVGEDYRLLFRLKPNILEVINLINRKDLERTIKSLA